MGSPYEVDLAGLTLVCKDVRINETQVGGSSGSSLSATELGALDGATNANTGTGKTVILGTSGALALAGATTIASTSASALTVGANGATNPVLKVNANTASQATGIQVTGAAAAGGVAVAAISSGTDENLTIDAKGAGTIGIGATSTGAVTITPATTVTGAITPTGGVAAAGGFTVSPRNWHTGGNPASVSTDFTDQTTVNTEVYIAEVFVPANATITGVAIFNGSAAANNVKVGLANSAGAVVATSASTAHTGNDQYQRVPFTSTYAAKGPATYYVLTFYDTNAAQANAHTIGNFGASKQTGQTYATGFTTITPPTTFTTALGPVASLY